MQTITRCFVIDGVEMVEKWRWVGRVLTPDQKETITISGIIEPSTNVNTVDPSNINVIGRLQSTPSAKILFSVLFIYTRLSTFIGRDNLDVFIRYFFPVFIKSFWVKNREIRCYFCQSFHVAFSFRFLFWQGTHRLNIRSVEWIREMISSDRLLFFATFLLLSRASFKAKYEESVIDR